jgi:hypothetical protein
MIVHLGDTLPVVIDTIKVNGGVLDLTDATVDVVIAGPVTVEGAALVAEDATTGVVTYVWETGDTDEPGVYQVRWVVTTDLGTLTVQGQDVVIYDPSALWVTPADVELLAGQQSDLEATISAIVAAQEAITVYCVRPIPVSTPAAVRRACAILAGRVLTAPKVDTTGSVVSSETIGDYSVRYASPQLAGSLLDPSAHSDVVRLLRPWRPANYSSDLVVEGESRATGSDVAATQVTYDQGSGVIEATTVQGALDWIAENGAGGAGVPGPTGPAGPQGPQGEPGAPGANGTNGTNGTNGADALWNFLGAYGAGTAYSVGDVVTYDGETWYRVNANGGNVGDTPSEGTFWTKVAAKGNTGTTGSQGPQGETGAAGATGATGAAGTTIVASRGAGSQVDQPSAATSLLSSTVTLPACTTGDTITVRGSISYLNNSGGARTPVLTIKIGATSILAITAGSTSAGATARQTQFEATIRCGSTTTQQASGIWSIGLNSNQSVATGVATETISSGSLALDVLVSGAGTATQNFTLGYLVVQKVAA